VNAPSLATSGLGIAMEHEAPPRPVLDLLHEGTGPAARQRPVNHLPSSSALMKGTMPEGRPVRTKSARRAGRPRGATAPTVSPYTGALAG